MNKKGLIIASSLLSISAVSIVTIASLNAKKLGTFATVPQTNAEYSISTWAYDGWCKNTSIISETLDIDHYVRAFMFHSTSEGAGAGVAVRSDVKLAVLLRPSDQDTIGEVTENLQYSVTNNMPSIKTTSQPEEDEHHNPTWPLTYLQYCYVQFIVGDFTFEEDEGGFGRLTPNEDFNNFTFKSISASAYLMHSEYSDEQSGFWYRVDFEDEYLTYFNSLKTELGYVIKGTKEYPRTGFTLNSVTVTYGCSY